MILTEKTDMLFDKEQRVTNRQKIIKTKVLARQLGNVSGRAR